MDASPLQSPLPIHLSNPSKSSGYKSLHLVWVSEQLKKAASDSIVADVPAIEAEPIANKNTVPIKEFLIIS